MALEKFAVSRYNQWFPPCHKGAIGSMLKHFQNRNSPVLKITMGILLGIISLVMVITLVPGALTPTTTNPDTVATVGGEPISAEDVHLFFQQIARGQNMPPEAEHFFLGQIVDELVFEHALQLEAQRLGISVTPQEQANRIRQILPAAFTGDTWVGKDAYSAMVQQRTGMTVSDFESNVRTQLLQDRFRAILTDGLTVAPEDIQQEFRERNDKVKLDYVLIKATDLASTINPTDQELAAFFAKNASRYRLPERRSASYALLDESQIRDRAKVGDAEVQDYYKTHLSDYKVADRVHVEQILFKTIGKTDAETAEIQKKAQDVLRQAKSGANFEDLAKQNSDDASKDKGGDLGWIVRGQTLPEFEKVAFTLQPGSVSDLVKAPYGFQIIKVLEHQPAHTEPLDQVRLTILSTLSDEKIANVTEQVYDQIASDVRKSSHQSLEDLAKKFGMQTGQTPLADATQPVGDFGDAQDLHNTLFHQRPGELSAPLRAGKGILVLSVKEIQPAHAATLAEVHDKVLKDYQTEQSVQMAKTKAQDLATRAHGGASLADAAKALGLQSQSTDLFAINSTSVTGIGPAKDVAAAFKMQTGQTSNATLVNGNWIVYTVTDHEAPNPADLPAQTAEIEKSLLDGKRSVTFAAFQTALVDRLKKEGKIKINEDAITQMSKS